MKWMMPVALVYIGLCCGCQKIERTEYRAMNYTIGGLADMTMKSTDTASLPLIIKYIDGPKDSLMLYVSGMPSGTTANYVTASGIPEFTTALRFHTVAAPVGNYIIKITASGKGLMQSKELKLHIQD